MRKIIRTAIVLVFAIQTHIGAIGVMPSAQPVVSSRTVGLEQSRVIDIPGEIGKVTHTYQGTNQSKKLKIICIPELHCDYESSRNIVEILGYAKKQYGKSLRIIGVEGAWDKVDVEWIRHMPEHPLKNLFIESLMEKGLLTGAEKYGVVENDIALYGIEEKEFYKRNVKELWAGAERTRASTL